MILYRMWTLKACNYCFTAILEADEYKQWQSYCPENQFGIGQKL